MTMVSWVSHPTWSLTPAESSGGIINNEPFQTTFHKPSSGLLGTIVAIYEIGCFVGAICCALFGERLGRRYSIAIGTIFMLGGAAFQAASNTAGQIIGARIISGIGMVSTVLPL